MKTLALLLLLPLFTNAANILFLQTFPAQSHHIWMSTLMNELVERGHNITSLAPLIVGERVPNIHYLLLLDNMTKWYEEHWNNVDLIALGRNKLEMKSKFYQFLAQYIKDSTQSKGFYQLLQYPDDFKFDLIIYEYIGGPFLVNLVTKFGNPPIIGVTSTTRTSASKFILRGSITSPSFLTIGMTRDDLAHFWKRLQNYFIVFHLEIMKYYFTAKPSETEKNTRIILINSHPATNHIEPLMPNVIPVGGLHIQSAKNLPEDLQDVMESAENGVILFSLGSLMRNVLCEAHLTEILEAFRSLPQYIFLFKHESSTLPVELPLNVVMRKWMPQFDILSHPNLKLFISQCGQLSVQEAIWNGVPILGLPIYIDQFENIEHCVEAGFGEEENIDRINRNSFSKLIEKMMKNPKYRDNAKIYSQIFKDQKESPLERAIWWTEYVLRHPNMTMGSPYEDVSPILRYSWDVLGFIFSVFLLILYINFKVFCCFIRKFLFKNLRKAKKD